MTLNDEGWRARVNKELRTSGAKFHMESRKYEPNPNLGAEKITQVRSNRHGYFTIPRNKFGEIQKQQKPQPLPLKYSLYF